MLLLRDKVQQWNNLHASFATCPCRWQSSGHEWTANSWLHNTRAVNLVLVHCGCHTGKWTVNTRIKSI